MPLIRLWENLRRITPTSMVKLSERILPYLIPRNFSLRNFRDFTLEIAEAISKGESGAAPVFILYMEACYKKLIKSIGENVNRPGLKETPQRAAKAFEYLTGGYHQDVRKVINNALFQSDNDEMIIVKDIELYSLCEHHLLPFFGKCHVGYLPDGKIIGLSKVARVVDIFSRRLQVQENLTRQIAETLMEQIGAKGIGVVIEARHLCMMMRGVEKQNSIMKTSCMLGLFRKESSTRAEFLSLIR